MKVIGDLVIDRRVEYKISSPTWTNADDISAISPRTKLSAINHSNLPK